VEEEFWELSLINFLPSLKSIWWPFIVTPILLVIVSLCFALSYNLFHLELGYNVRLCSSWTVIKLMHLDYFCCFYFQISSFEGAYKLNKLDELQSNSSSCKQTWRRT
jgi:hypothetical protein